MSKYEPEKTPYLGTFHEVTLSKIILKNGYLSLRKTTKRVSKCVSVCVFGGKNWTWMVDLLVY